MRGKKLINANHLGHHGGGSKLNQVKSTNKRKLQEIRSVQTKNKVQNIPNGKQQTKNNKQYLVEMHNGYEEERRQRQTMQYIPVTSLKPHLCSHQQLPSQRYQRNTDTMGVIRLRENHLMGNPTPRDNHGSQRKIKIFSAEHKQKSFSRSQNSSVKKRAGIQLTKTLLKKISDMYTDKDFQNRSIGSVGMNKSKEETTGVMTVNMSGRGVAEEYQLNDSDFQIVNNHTVNLSYSNNPLSFNDSGNWTRQNQTIEPYLPYQNTLNNSREYLGSSRQYTQNSSREMMLSNSRQFMTSSREMFLPNKEIKYGQGEINIKSSKLYAHKNSNSQYSKDKNRANEGQILIKMSSSGDLLKFKANTESIVVGEQPPARASLIRRGQLNSQDNSSRYFIRSKNKTMDQLSLKQSLVDDAGDYYQ